MNKPLSEKQILAICTLIAVLGSLVAVVASSIDSVLFVYIGCFAAIAGFLAMLMRLVISALPSDTFRTDDAESLEE